ncbi:MAG: PDZ domain-containing protein [Acidobacteria bacterium]|nr:PDZ domain-containing protein [Acidobacteriota bacterium]
MLSPKNSPRGKLMSQYVCARIIRMDEVDIAHFEYDRNNPLYFFLMNADEQIYTRYGGRDSAAVDSYLNLDSLELALKKGLDLHEQWKQGKLKAAPRPAPKFPREYPLLVERTFAKNQCVECHLIGDFQNIHRQLDGTLDKKKHLWRSPDFKLIGITLDIPKGLVVKDAAGPAAEAGMLAGDLIRAWNGTTVWTFGDAQYAYDMVDRNARQVKVRVERAGAERELTIALPIRWWLTDVRWRQSSVDPRVYFDDRPLTDDEKRQHGLPAEGFASMVRRVADMAKLMKTHELAVGDIVVAVDGVDRDPDVHTAELYLRLRKKPGDTVELEVLRNGQRLKLPLRTLQMSFRK